MKFTTVCAGMAFSVVSVSAFAQPNGQLELIFTQPAEGVYTQDWFAQKVGSRRTGGVDIYVVGDGKLGDFFGIISVNCQEPSNSSWIATGGYLSSDRVPTEAIRGLRKLACEP